MKEEIFWKNPRYKPRKPLKKNIKCDYLIIGGASTQVVCVMSAKHIVHRLLHKKSYLDDFFKHHARLVK